MWWVAALSGLWCSSIVYAAVFVVENFSADPNWVDRDSSEMLVVWDSGFGNTAGSLHGSFADQGAPFAETDAMRVNGTSSGGAFAGNYYTTYSGFAPDSATFSFSFYSDDVLPSDLRIRIGSGADLFSRSILSQATVLNGWQTISINLAYSGWLGGTEATYSNIFTAISFVDIQITRNGTSAQNFYLDNFSLNGNDPVPPGNEAIPEAATTQLLLLSGIFLASGIRRRLRKMATRFEG
jgi:hypothetical protein